MTSKQPVYCTNCKFFSSEIFDLGAIHECRHPISARTKNRYTGPETVYDLRPEEQNANCDCELYVEMEPKQARMVHQMQEWIRNGLRR